MDKYRASIAKKMLDASGITNIYLDNVPEDFKVPSMYFPSQEISPRPSTMNTYAEECTLYAYVFDVTGNKALEKADEIAGAIAKDRFYISLMNQDGSVSDGKLKVRLAGTRKVDDLSAIITVFYSNHIPYDEESVDYAKYIYAEIEIKAEGG